MTVTYHYVDPTGNITLLAEACESERRKEISSALMALEPTAEQVGFVNLDKEKPSLTMAGGEFCGNASISCAACWCEKNKVEKADIELNVSGADKPVKIHVEGSDGQYLASVIMPGHKSIYSRSFEYASHSFTLPVVQGNGITHLIVKDSADKALFEKAAPVWCSELGADALGIMLLDKSESVLTPLVYVPAADTLFWESSCASGTAAVCAYLKHGIILKEPGGTLSAEYTPQGVVLSGKAKIKKTVQVEINI